MKKRLISFMLLITVTSCVGFNTDYFKNLLTFISQAAKEVIYEETESYDEETTDSAVDRFEHELEKLDVRNSFEDESETESGSKTCTVWDNITPTQENYPYTNIPKSFEIEINGERCGRMEMQLNIFMNMFIRGLLRKMAQHIQILISIHKKL